MTVDATQVIRLYRAGIQTILAENPLLPGNVARHGTRDTLMYPTTCQTFSAKLFSS